MTGSGKLAAVVAGWTAVGVSAAQAQPSADLTLATNVGQCYQTGQTVTVQLVLANQSQSIYGVEAHLEYDNAVLDYQATVPGGLWLVLQNQADETLGTIDFAAVSLSVPASNPYTVATFTFTVLSEPGCGVGLMSFRASPETLASVFGPPFTFVPTLHDLPDLAIGDAAPPTIGCPPNWTFECPSDVPAAASNLMEFLGQGGTASDNCGAVTISHLGDTPSGNQILRGYRATDICGNTSDCQQTITVADTEPPTITCPPDVTTVADAGVCYATGVTLGNPTVDDNCGVAGVTNDAPTQFPVGQTAVTWTVTDTSGFTAQCVQLVTVNDAEPPTATCPMDMTVTEDPGQGGAIVTFSAMVSDNCPGATVACVPPSGAFFPLGTTTVTCTAADAAGNTDVCTFTITVLPTDVSISGQVRSAFDTLPLAGVRVRAMNSGVTDFTDGDGLYELVIPAGPPETVAPCRDGWVFTPPERTYANPLTDVTGEDYSGRHVFDVDFLPNGDGQVGPGDLSYFATSWLQPVPPGQALHDFDCNGAVNGGDLSYFATAWLKSVFAPGIALPPCRLCGAKFAPQTAQASCALVPVAVPSTPDPTDTLPAAVARIAVGQTYYLELWALDRSDGLPGLTSVFVNLEIAAGTVEVESWQISSDFALFAGGDLTDSGLLNLGGATLESGVAAGAWVRVAVITVRAARMADVGFNLTPGSGGIAVYGQGLVPAEALHLSTRKLQQRMEMYDDDLVPTVPESALQVGERRF